MKKWKLDRIVSVATLVTSVLALILVLKRPAPVAAPQTPTQAAANAQSFQNKIAQFDQPATDQPAVTNNSSPQNSSVGGGSSKASEFLPAQPSNSAAQSSLGAANPSQSKPTPAQVRITSDEITAALAQASGAIPGAAGQVGADSDLGAMPNILDQQVSFDGDQAHGQFLVNVAGKNVWITVAGHLGSKDGFATFEPTQFKVGDLDIPVSLVNGPLQKRLAEQRGQLKLPDNVGGIQVENGQLVLTQK
jgi:hypothetical protein